MVSCLASVQASYDTGREQEDTVAPPCVLAETQVKRSGSFVIHQT